MLANLEPMLAVASPPFDHPEYAFEVKWDGVRALAAVEAGGWRMWGRGGTDYTARYPELAFLRRLPTGTVVDGELVVLTAGKPDLAALLRRHALDQPSRVRWAARWAPVRYVLFDLLIEGGRSRLGEPWRQRRERLEGVCAALAEPTLFLSEAVRGRGRALYDVVVAQGYEGVMAKHLAAPYRPGRRSRDWRKIKPPSAATRRRATP